MRKWIIVLLLCVFPLLAAGPARAQSARTPIRIGVPVPLTGPLAVNGEDNLRGIRLYFNRIGNRIDGRKVELLVEDTAGNPTMGLNKVQMLVERDKVQVILGVISSAVAYAIRDFVHNNKVPTMITTAGATDLTLSKKSPYIFRTANDNVQEPGVLGYYTAAKLGYKTAVTIADDFAAGREMIAAFRKTYTGAGGKILKSVYAPLGTTDFAPYLTRIKDDKADVVVAMMYGIDGARFIKAYRDYGLTKPVVGQGALMSNDVIKAAGKATLGVITAKQYSDALNTPRNRKFVRAFLKAYKVRPDAWSEQAYVGAEAVAEAVKKVHGNIENTPRFLKALAEARFQGPAGLVHFDKNHQRIFDVYIRKVERRGKRLENAVIAKIPDVSEHWTPK